MSSHGRRKEHSVTVICRVRHAGQPPNVPISRHEHPAARSHLAQRPLPPLSPTSRAPARYGRTPHAVEPLEVTDIERRRCSSPAPPRAADVSTKMSPLFDGLRSWPKSTAVRKVFVRHCAGGWQRSPSMLLKSCAGWASLAARTSGASSTRSASNLRPRVWKTCCLRQTAHHRLA